MGKTAEEIGQEKLAQIKAEKETKAKETVKAEPKDAAGVSSPEPKKTEEKTKEELIKEAGEKAVDQAKKDKEILSKKDEELGEEDKTRKSELLKIKEEEAKEAEEVKKKARNEKIEKRMDELVSTIKRLDSEGKQFSEENKKLKAELAELKKSQTPLNVDELLEKAQADRDTKYRDEDKDKPREQRREMSNEELNDWMLEDMAAASRWLAKQERRREREIQEERDKGFKKEAVEDFIKKQTESLQRAIAKHPEINVKERVAELKAEGKTDQEVLKIILKENDKFRILTEIHKEDKEGKYLSMEDGPEKAIEEMERRLKKPSETDVEQKAREEKEEENRLEKIRQDAAEAERQRIANLDIGITSSRKGDEKPDIEKTEFEKEQERMAVKAGIKPDRLKELKARRKKIPGADE